MSNEANEETVVKTICDSGTNNSPRLYNKRFIIFDSKIKYGIILAFLRILLLKKHKCHNKLKIKEQFLVIFHCRIFKFLLTNHNGYDIIIRRNGYAGVAELADAQDLKSCGP